MVRPSQRYKFQHNLKLILKIFLIAIIPLLTLGFSVFEKTPLYSWIINIHGVESALSKRLTTQYGDSHRLILKRQQNKEEFDDLWKLVLKYSDAEISRHNPILISRMAIENGAYVITPQKNKVVLIPDSVPVVALFCTEQQLSRGECKGKDSIIVGTVGDVKQWIEKKRQVFRSTVDLILSIVSILFGLALELRQPNSAV